MRTIVIALLFISISTPIMAGQAAPDVEFQEISGLIEARAKEIQSDLDKNNEEALYSFNLDKKNEPLFERVSEFRKKHPEYNKKLGPKISLLNAVLDKVNEKHAKELPKAREDAINALKSAEHSLNKLSKKSDSKVDVQATTYEEWFTLQQTGIKSGKKYSFLACVIGSRNATAVRCHTPGSAAKRVFYNTDDIQDQEMKAKWVNTNNQNMCVTAYVTGGEAFVVSINEPSKCK